jgi:hypothetical protein
MRGYVCHLHGHKKSSRPSIDSMGHGGVPDHLKEHPVVAPNSRCRQADESQRNGLCMQLVAFYLVRLIWTVACTQSYFGMCVAMRLHRCRSTYSRMGQLGFFYSHLHPDLQPERAETTGWELTNSSPRKTGQGTA